MSFKNKTAFITGASRGIGRAIALRLASEGANIIIAAKSTEENPKLGGTIFSVAEEVEAAGLQKPEPPKPLDAVSENQVRLVCWMAVKGRDEQTT